MTTFLARLGDARNASPMSRLSLQSLPIRNKEVRERKIPK